jgi:hypothetical protein
MPLHAHICSKKFIKPSKPGFPNTAGRGLLSPLATRFPRGATIFQLCIRWVGSQPTRFFRICLAHKELALRNTLEFIKTDTLCQLNLYRKHANTDIIANGVKVKEVRRNYLGVGEGP